MTGYRPSDPYEWGTQGIPPERIDHEGREPFQGPPIPKYDEPAPEPGPEPAPEEAPEPREWVMEGYIPMLWRELLAGIRQGKTDIHRLFAGRNRVRTGQVPEPQSQPGTPPLGQVAQREAPQHRQDPRPGGAPDPAL